MCQGMDESCASQVTVTITVTVPHVVNQAVVDLRIRIEAAIKLRLHS